MKTGRTDVSALNERTVDQYSDMLLHDMGPELADFCLGRATPSEFRTEILMGLRFREQFLHDGSATTIVEAIERHGGEASKSRDAFFKRKQKEQQTILDFLHTL